MDEFLEPLTPPQGNLGNTPFVSTSLLDSYSVWEKRTESFWNQVFQCTGSFSCALGGKVQGKLFLRPKQELGQRTAPLAPRDRDRTSPGRCCCLGVGKLSLARVRCLKWRGVSKTPNPWCFPVLEPSALMTVRTKQILLSFSGVLGFFKT